MQQKSPHCHPSSFLIGWSNTWHWKRQWAGHWDNRNRIVLMKDMKSKDFPRFQNFAPLEGSRVNFQPNFQKVNQLGNHRTAVYLDTWLKIRLFLISNCQFRQNRLTFIKRHRILNLTIQFEKLPLPMITGVFILDTNCMMMRYLWIFIFALKDAFHTIWHAFLFNILKLSNIITIKSKSSCN